MRNTLFTFLLTAIFISLGTAQEKTETVEVGGFSFNFAKPWVKQQVTSAMRIAQLQYSQADEKLQSVDLIFYHMGGSIEANLDRWKGQFGADSETKVEKKEVNGKKVIYFTGIGTFSDSMGGPFAPKVDKSDYTALFAIVPTEDPARHVFLKLKGPKADVAAATKAFYSLTESALKK